MPESEDAYDAEHLFELLERELAADPTGTAVQQLVWRAAFRCLNCLDPKFEVGYVNEEWLAADNPEVVLAVLRYMLSSGCTLVFHGAVQSDYLDRAFEQIITVKSEKEPALNLLSCLVSLFGCITNEHRKRWRSAKNAIEKAEATECSGTNSAYLLDDFDLHVSRVDASDGLSDTIYDSEAFGFDEYGVWPYEVTSVIEALYQSGSDWKYWCDWYQKFVTGEDLLWELQRRVAMIDDAFWEAGPAAVAAEIERIKAEYLAEKAPQAERVEFNKDTAKFFTIPLEIAKPDLLGATLTQVQDALDDVLANPSNGLRDTSRETRVLNRFFTRYANDPQQIEMGFVSVHRGLMRQITINDELPASEENLALMHALEDGARAIRATHPEVEDNRTIIDAQTIRELPPEAVEKLEDALPLLVAISEDALADDWQRDIPQLINDATQPLPTGAPALPGVDETIRIASRAAKISIWAKSADVIHKIDGSAGYKAARIAAVLAGLVTLFLSLLT